MNLKQNATAAFDAVETELREICRWMYENPELAYEEHLSSSRLAEFLGRNGFEVTRPAYGLDTAFEANAGSSGPRVVICAEYDALAGVGQPVATTSSPPLHWAPEWPSPASQTSSA